MTIRTITPLTTPARTHLDALEKRWSGSLHLSLLSSPLRKCIVTSKVLPTSIMVQLKSITLPTTPAPSSESASPSAVNTHRVVVLPDQILHAKFAPKKKGKGVWFTLDRRIYAQLHTRGSWKMLHPKATFPPALAELVHRQLGERVCQESQLLLQKFAHRSHIHLIQPPTTTATHSLVSFTINNVQVRDAACLGAIPSFSPRFAHPHQSERFFSSMQTLAAMGGGDGLESVFRVKQSGVTVPLGVALYRLHLWSQVPPRTNGGTNA